MAPSDVPSDERDTTSQVDGLETKGGGTRRSKMATVYSTLAVLSIPVGVALAIPVGDRAIFISATQLIVILFYAHLVVSRKPRSFHAIGATIPRPVIGVLVGAILLAFPIAWAPDIGSGTVAYFNFITGTLGGVMVGTTWGTLTPRRMSAIDLGIAGFVLISAVQLLLGFSQASGESELHGDATTGWGHSNYVAGVLIVAALALVGRGIGMRGRGRFLVLVPAALAVVAAMMAYSRGAILALGVGLAALLWTVGSSRRSRIILRSGTIVLPVAVWVMIEHATAVRLRLNTQVLKNIDARVELLRIAWKQFLGHLLTGTGWTGLRPESADLLGQPVTFAHNAVLSFLQIGGVLAIPYLACLGWAIVVGIRSRVEMAGAICAAIMISMTDPFFEGTIGSLIAVAVVVRGVVAHSRVAQTGGYDSGPDSLLVPPSPGPET